MYLLWSDIVINLFPSTLYTLPPSFISFHTTLQDQGCLPGLVIFLDNDNPEVILTALEVHMYMYTYACTCMYMCCVPPFVWLQLPVCFHAYTRGIMCLQLTCWGAMCCVACAYSVDCVRTLGPLSLCLVHWVLLCVTHEQCYGIVRVSSDTLTDACHSCYNKQHVMPTASTHAYCTCTVHVYMNIYYVSTYVYMYMYSIHVAEYGLSLSS